MNFLLHRYVAARALGSIAAGHGAMLPDLWRMADRKVRAQADIGTFHSGQHQPDAIDSQVEAGVAHHLLADKWFHQSPIFTEGEHATVERFRAAEFVAGRMGLLAHVSWELCLDGALVRRDGLATILDQLRAGYQVAGGAPSQRAAGVHHFDRVARSSEERAAFDSNMRQIGERLLDGRWVAAYASGAGLSALIDGTRRRLGLDTLGERDRTSLGAAMDELLARADAQLASLLAAAP